MGKRIMIIDDEKDIRVYLKTLFEKNGYETETAKDGEEGFPKTKAFKPDLITLDILMPKQSGIRLYNQLKEDEDLKDIPIVVLTGLSQYQQFYQQDFPEDELPDAFIEKPIQINNLYKEFSKYLKHTVTTLYDLSDYTKGLKHIKLPEEVIEIIDNEVLPLWGKVSHSPDFVEIEEFALVIESFSQENNIEPLINYGQELFRLTNNMEIEKMDSVLKNFPFIINQLKELNES